MESNEWENVQSDECTSFWINNAYCKTHGRVKWKSIKIGLISKQRNFSLYLVIYGKETAEERRAFNGNILKFSETGQWENKETEE